MVEKTYKCVICGKEIKTTSNRGARFCSKECRNEYIRKTKAAQRTEEDDKFGSTPEEYAAKQKDETLKKLPPIVPEQLEVITDKGENMGKTKEAQSILVYMKGRIEGAMPFCQDETVADLLGKLLNGVNTLIEIMEEL